jgi:integrase
MFQQEADELIRRLCVFGAKKIMLGDAHRFTIRSKGTATAYRNCVADFLSFRADGGCQRGGPYLRIEMNEFLLMNSATWQQKTLDQHRQALCKVFSVDLPKYRSHIVSKTKGRAYTHEEFLKIIRFLSQKHRLAICLLYYCGLRTEEIYRITDINILKPSDNRPWRSDLFAGLEGMVICTCTGKGGLTRLIAIPTELYAELELCRFIEAKTVTNRGKDLCTCFGLVGGQALSTAFRRASIRALGFCLGAHGLRHSYVQRRLAQLKAAGFSAFDRLAICSQEVGHFREDITLHYTTPRTQ